MPVINTMQDGYSVVSIGSLSNTTYTALTSSTTAPSVGLLYSDNIPDTPNFIHVTPFSSQTSGTPGFRLVGWRKYLQTAGTFLYVPTVLAEFSPTFASSPPTASIDATTYNMFSGISQGSAQPAGNLYNPGTSNTDGSIASALVDAIGCQMVTVQFKLSTGSGVTMGILWAIC